MYHKIFQVNLPKTLTFLVNITQFQMNQLNDSSNSIVITPCTKRVVLPASTKAKQKTNFTVVLYQVYIKRKEKILSVLFLPLVEVY